MPNSLIHISESSTIHHKSLMTSVKALWDQYLYGDGWRLIEIVIAIWVILRGLSILFFGGMDAMYYSFFPLHDHTMLWGMAALFIGSCRIAGTIINGKWQRSPRLRWSAGVMGAAYQGIHCLIFAQLGYTLIATGYAFWLVLECMGVIRSSIDIIRKRELQCRNG